MQKFFVNIVILAFYSLKLIDCTQVIYDNRFLEECLSAHNRYRGLHENTPPLRLNRTASEYAVQRVIELAKIQMNLRKPMQDKRVVYGENFYWYYDTAGYHSCEDAVNVWYNGIKKYNYNRPGFSDSTGGFSQVVWRGSQSLGCAKCESDKNPSYPETFIVCNYYPAGNIEEQYPYNVYPIKEKPSVGSVPSTGSGSGSNEWSNVKPGHRPGNKPGEKPINGGNRPGAVPSRPDSSQRPQHSKPPTAPNYPLTLLYPLIY